MKKNIIIRNIIKVIIGLLLLGCFKNVPHGYYTLVRIFSCIGFAYIGSIYSNEYLKTACYAIAILFNPIAEIHLTRYIWLYFDGIIAGILIIWGILDIGHEWSKKDGFF